MARCGNSLECSTSILNDSRIRVETQSTSESVIVSLVVTNLNLRANSLDLYHAQFTRELY